MNGGTANATDPGTPPAHGAALDAAATAYLDGVGNAVEGLLGPTLVGAYLIGSGALGDFDPERSDLDVVVVAARTLSPHERTEVVSVLSDPSLACPATKLELVVYPLQAVKGPNPSVVWDMNLGVGRTIGRRVSFDPSSEPSHWFVLDVALAREHARPLSGPPPRDVFGEIPRPRVLRSLRDSMGWYRRHDRDGAQAVLATCRAWHYLEEGTWSSKVSAASWTRPRTPHRDLIDRALAARASMPAEPLDPGAIDRFVSSVLGLIQEALQDG